VVDEDIEPTSPLPVILPGAVAVPRPEPVAAPRGFFEAAQPAKPTPAARPVSVTGSVDPPPSDHYPAGVTENSAWGQSDGAQPGSPAAGRPPASGEHIRVVPEAANAKLEQIKDLYLTAEAIGEDALDKHFDQVSLRQRELIREFFERSGPAGDAGSR
jgi:hypothetical protein